MKRVRNFLTMLLIFQILLCGLAPPVQILATTNNKVSGTLRVTMHKNYSIMEPYLNAFMDKYPNVTIEYTCLPDYDADITKLIEDNQAPDVYLVPSTMTEDRLEEELEPLGTVGELSEKYNYVDQGYCKNDKVYSLTMYACLYGLLYNKEIFEQAGIVSLPTTPEEFLADCELIKQHTEAIPFFTNYNDYWAVEYWEFFPFVEMSGRSDYKYTDYLHTKQPFSKDSNHYQVYKLLYDLIHSGYTEELGEGNYGQATSELVNGQIASMVMGSWAFKEIQDSSPTENNLGFMPFPNNIDGKQYTTLRTEYNYGVSAKGKNKEAAKAFVSFMLDESGFALDTGNISILKSDPMTDYLSDMKHVTLLAEVVPTAEDRQLLNNLQSEVKPGSYDEIKEIMDAAAGKINLKFDSIMTNWNREWENGRPEFSSDTITDYGNNNTSTTVSNDQLFISESEQAFISANPTFQVGYLMNFAPFSYDRDGEPTGLAIDVCEEIREKLGINIVYQPYDSASEAVAALKNHSIHFIAGMIHTNTDQITYSKSFYKALNVYVCKGEMNIAQYEDYTAALAAYEQIEQIARVNNKTEKANLFDCIQAVADHKADYTLCNYCTADYYIHDKEYKDLDIIPSSSYSTLHIVFDNKVDNSLLALINKCMYTISNEQLQVALLSYSTPPEKPLTIKRLVEANPMIPVVIISFISGIIVIAVSVLFVFKSQGNKRLSFEMQKYQVLGKLTNEYMFDYDYRNHCYNFDTKFQEDFDYLPTLVIPKNKEIDKKYQTFIAKLNRVKFNSNEQETPFQLLMANDKVNWFKMVLSTIKDKNGRPIYIVGKIVDVQKEMLEKQSIQDSADKDALTNLFNRRGFEKRLPKKASNILYMVSDLDDFKKVNDSLGHLGGDKVLCLMGIRLRQALGKNAVIARFGGDEFIAAISGITVEEAHERLQKLVKSMDTTVQFEGVNCHLSISVGALYCKDKTEIATMFTRADEVLYEKKKHGKNGYAIKEEG